MKWNTTPPPNDGTTFLGCWGYPWPCAMMYNPYDDDYSIAIPAVQEHGDGNESWFETESCAVKEITAWMPMPELK